MYNFLKNNYIEDDEGVFKLHYTKKFLKWLFVYKGFEKDWKIVIRANTEKSNKIVGFISGTVVKLSINGQEKDVAEINFLCVHKKLRSKRMVPVLIREITRRMNKKGIYQGIYTAVKILPTPLTRTRYWHKLINYEKLKETRFTEREKPLVDNIKLINDENFVELKEEYIEQACQILNDYLKKYVIHPIFDIDEFKFLFFGNDIVKSYVYLENRKVVDFVSYYELNNLVTNNPKYDELKVAYLFYYSNKKLIENLLSRVKENGYDVFNVLDVMENVYVVQDLGFSKGSGFLNYYLFNWRTINIRKENVGVILF